MYYRLDNEKINGNTLVHSVSHDDVFLTGGQLITKPVTKPFRYMMEVCDPGYDLDPDYEGPPAEGPPWEANDYFDYYDSGCLMHKRLYEGLLSAGIHNLQSFPAIVERPDTGEVFPDYLAINVVGLVSCAVLEKSESDPLGELHFFHKLVIDRSRTHDLLLFRLAEYPPTILVHENVATKLMEAHYSGLVIEPVAES